MGPNFSGRLDLSSSHAPLTPSDADGETPNVIHPKTTTPSDEALSDERTGWIRPHLPHSLHCRPSAPFLFRLSRTCPRWMWLCSGGTPRSHSFRAEAEYETGPVRSSESMSHRLTFSTAVLSAPWSLPAAPSLVLPALFW
ncbi:hypothetical protein BLNAU_20431 [Blattamonas nauphoetae]|uniref:Uncharacterized protein n=1 Tax=Blattamonas nauphoetae TaxID=2049346 RepID=A0ABQ9WYT3_9EUKA|nr:hypothetical protein BLNAU_20431 [Blattamonas nauphoetae]